jgi:transcriptional regulator with XRE-family HTH domain
LGISQEKLAERAGLHRTYLSDVERGARNISLSSIEKLPSALLACPRKPDAHGPDAAPAPADDFGDILLVEDRMPDVERALRALKQAAIANRIRVAQDGAAALDFFSAPTGTRIARDAGPRNSSCWS